MNDRRPCVLAALSRCRARSVTSTLRTRPRARCWCARCTPASAAARRPSSSAAGCRRASTRPCGRRSRRATSPRPVKYGYLSVGVVERGPAELLGPHRLLPLPAPDAVRGARPRAVTVVPDAVPAARAVLAGTVETAVNALWDAAPLVGDRIAVVGGGMVGCSVAALLARFPGVRVAAGRRRPGAGRRSPSALGVDFALPGGRRSADCDLVVHASATEAGPRPLAGAARRTRARSSN